MPLTIDTSPRTIQRHRAHTLTPGPARDALSDPLTGPLPAAEWDQDAPSPAAGTDPAETLTAEPFAPEPFAAEPFAAEPFAAEPFTAERVEPSYRAAPAWTDGWAADEPPTEPPTEPPADQQEHRTEPEHREQRWTDSWSDRWVEDEPTPVPAPRPVPPATPLVGGGPAVPPTRTIALFPPIRAGGGRHRLPAPVRRRPGPIAAGLMVAATTLAAGSLRGPLTATGGAHAAARAPLAVHSPDDRGPSFE